VYVAHLCALALATTRTDTKGRFEVNFPLIPAALLAGLNVIASAPGLGFDGNQLKTDTTSQKTMISLDPERIVEGRLVDVQGQPTAGVSVRVQSLNV
jgi:hypothetical protein